MTKTRLLIALLIFAGYVLTRTLFLTKLPIFTDEAIYIRWGQIALQDAAHRFISLEDGKQPLFIWLILPALQLVSDPLVAGRVVSIFTGFVSLIGLITLSWKLFGEKVGWLSGFLYTIIPFFVLYDRLALYDSLTTAIMVTSLLLSIFLVQSLRLDIALLLGMTIGAGLLTKSSAQFALILLPASLLLFDWKKKQVKNRFFRWIGLSLVVVFLSILFQTILRLSPLYHMTGLKNLTFIVSAKEFIADPLSRLWGNLRGLTDWTQAYLTPPIIGILLVGLIHGLKSHLSKTTLLSLWFLTPFLALAAFGKVLYPRFILFMLIPLLPLVALGTNTIQKYLTHIANEYNLPAFVIYLSFVILLSYPLLFSFKVIFKPIDAPLPTVDRNQFINDWPSGYGIPEVVDLLRDRGQHEPIFVGTEGTFGLTPSALIIYLKDEPNIQIKGYWPISGGIEELTDIAQTGKPTYILFKDTQEPKPDWPLELIARYQKGKGNVYMNLYQVIPK